VKSLKDKSYITGLGVPLGPGASHFLVLVKLISINLPTPWSSPSWETNSQLSYSRKSLPFTKTESSTACSQEPATGYYPEPDASRPPLPTLFP